ncbi:MAG: glycosyltransferase family 4 protein [Thermoplasmata archaeon]
MLENTKRTKIKIAFVVQRYGLEVSGGAELHCRLLAEHLAKYFDIDVLTTCAVDYITWRNYYKPGIEILNGVRVIRFPVDCARRKWIFGGLSRIVYNLPHPEFLEKWWMKAQGPYSTELLKYIENKKNNYSCFIFFTYLYCTTFYGLPYVKNKSILIPTAEDTPQLRLKIFKNVFNTAKMIIYNTPEEKSLINSLFENDNIISEIIGVSINIPPKIEPERFRNRYGIRDKFILYIGRITVDKGCDQLIEYFIRYKKEKPDSVKLVLIGKNYMNIPHHPDIVHTGYIMDEDKFSALKGAEALVLSSRYESLSMVLLEAWSMEKPVLANRECNVVEGQLQRSKGGLLYSNYNDFKNALNTLLNDKNFAHEIGKAGHRYFIDNYSWDRIEKKYLEIIENFD